MSIQVELHSKQETFLRYLPFVKQGALLIDCEIQHALGQTLILNVNFAELKQSITVEGKIVWIGMNDKTYKKMSGIQLLGKEGFQLNQMIENYLIGLVVDEV